MNLSLRKPYKTEAFVKHKLLVSLDRDLAKKYGVEEWVDKQHGEDLENEQEEEKMHEERYNKHVSSEDSE